METNVFCAPAERHFQESMEAMRRSVLAEQMAAVRIERTESAMEQSRSLIERIWTDRDDEASGAR